jgi:signal transduction histidine kinase
MSASWRRLLSRLPVLTVQGWFGVASAVIGVLVAASAVVIAVLLAQGRVVSGELDNSILPAQAQAYRLQGALVDEETGVRGYGITSSPSFLQPYTSGRGVESAAQARLRALIGQQPALAADLANVQHAASRWRTSYAIPLINLARKGPLGPSAASQLVRSKHAFDQLRTLFAAQNTHLAAAAARDSAHLKQVRTIQDWVFALILAVFLLAAAALPLVLHSAVVGPLSRLGARARLVASGDFGHAIEPAGPADLRAVAADVEAMRSELAAALAAANAAQQVALRQAADLDAYAAELSRSNGELEQFAYVASHDLQEPLRKVASFCQLLERRYSDKLDDRGRQYIDFAVDGAKRLQVLINDLLTFSRVGRSGDVRVRVPLGEPLGNAIAALGTAIEESGAIIETPAELPEVLGDPSLLAMLWQNLVGNAIKFRAPGRAPVVRITAAGEPGADWQVCVADNGIGIAPEFAEKVFVIFQRLHPREAYPGTGIGLALCKRIVEHHGGGINLDAAYEGGTRICFTMPRIAGPEPGQASGEPGITTEGIPA